MGKFALKQQIGISMGSPLSLTLAIMYCCRSEFYFLNSLKGDTKINGIRYMDDLLLLIQIKHKSNYEDKINEIILDLDGLYKNNSGVKLEIEEYGENITFLETKNLV